MYRKLFLSPKASLSWGLETRISYYCNISHARICIPSTYPRWFLPSTLRKLSLAVPWNNSDSAVDFYSTASLMRWHLCPDLLSMLGTSVWPRSMRCLCTYTIEQLALSELFCFVPIYASKLAVLSLVLLCGLCLRWNTILQLLYFVPKLIVTIMNSSGLAKQVCSPAFFFLRFAVIVIMFVDKSCLFFYGTTLPVFQRFPFVRKRKKLKLISFLIAQLFFHIIWVEWPQSVSTFHAFVLHYMYDHISQFSTDGHFLPMVIAVSFFFPPYISVHINVNYPFSKFLWMLSISTIILFPLYNFPMCNIFDFFFSLLSPSPSDALLSRW